MRSELVKKLELAKINTSFIDYGHDGFNRAKHHSYNSALVDAIRIVKTHEAQQMKEPFYQLTEEQQNRLERLRRKRQFVVSPCIYDSWAIEQEKLKEEK